MYGLDFVGRKVFAFYVRKFSRQRAGDKKSTINEEDCDSVCGVAVLCSAVYLICTRSTLCVKLL